MKRYSNEEVERLSRKMLEQRCTLRTLEKTDDVPHSTLHNLIHKRLPHLDPELYDSLLLLFKENIDNGRIKGGTKTGTMWRERKCQKRSRR